MSSGLGTDPSGERLYHVDSARGLVWAFPLDAPSPGGGRELFVDTAEYAGVPDGLAVTAEGSVWVAMAGGGRPDPALNGTARNPAVCAARTVADTAGCLRAEGRT